MLFVVIWVYKVRTQCAPKLLNIHVTFLKVLDVEVTSSVWMQAGMFILNVCRELHMVEKGRGASYGRRECVR
jgi:hypothetical protein